MFYTISSLISSHWTELRWIALVIGLSVIYGFCNRLWFGKKPLILVLPIDRQIPLLPWTVFIYNMWYPILLLSCALLAIYEKAVFGRFLAAYTLASVASFAIFIFFQNEVPRAYELTGKNVAEKLLRFTWRMDNPYNGFPSIHVLACTMTILAIQASSLPFSFKTFIWVSQLLIIGSTLTTKQHVVLDLLGGSSLALLGWFLTSGNPFI